MTKLSKHLFLIRKKYKPPLNEKYPNSVRLAQIRIRGGSLNMFSSNSKKKKFILEQMHLSK